MDLSPLFMQRLPISQQDIYIPKSLCCCAAGVLFCLGGRGTPSMSWMIGYSMLSGPGEVCVHGLRIGALSLVWMKAANTGLIVWSIVFVVSINSYLKSLYCMYCISTAALTLHSDEHFKVPGSRFQVPGSVRASRGQRVVSFSCLSVCQSVCLYLTSSIPFNPSVVPGNSVLKPYIVEYFQCSKLFVKW